jgi:hypothetical protein
MRDESIPRMKDGFSLGQAKRCLSNILRLTDLTTMLHGPPGVGKSAVVEQIAKEENYDLIVCSLLLFDPTELKGIPYVEAVSDVACGIKRTIWAVPDRWPRPAVKYTGPEDKIVMELVDSRGKLRNLSFRYKGESEAWDEIDDPLIYQALRNTPEFRFRRGILFLDEFNVAPSLVQCVTLKLVDSGRIETYELPKEWRIVLAGNLGAEDGAYVSRTSSAVNNRFIHFFVEPNHREWISWGKENGMHQSIIGFIQAFPHLLSKVPERGEVAFPTPRMWANLSKLLNARELELEAQRGPRTEIESFEALKFRELSIMIKECGQAFVGMSVAVQLAAFFELYLEIDAESIIVNGDLSGVTHGNAGPDRIIAIVGSCAEFLKATERLGETRPAYYGNFASLLKILPPEYRIAAIEMLDDDMVENLREEGESFYKEVLSMVETAMIPQVTGFA